MKRRRAVLKSLGIFSVAAAAAYAAWLCAAGRRERREILSALLSDVSLLKLDICERLLPLPEALALLPGISVTRRTVTITREASTAAQTGILPPIFLVMKRLEAEGASCAGAGEAGFGATFLYFVPQSGQAKMPLTSL